MPFTHSDPRFTMWSQSPSIAINFPSRTAAIIPQPHEQKLHEVVNSLTFASFRFSAAALTLDKSSSPPRASPVPPPIVILSHSRRLTPCVPAEVDGWRKRLSLPCLVDPSMDCSVASQMKMK